MALTKEERKLLHQKAQQPTYGSGKPSDSDGFNGDIAYRKVEGAGTVQYLKENNSWTAISSSGVMPPLRVITGGGRSSSSSAGTGVTSHGDLTSLTDDDHTQYLLVDGTRAMTSSMIIGTDADGTDRSIVWGHSTLKTIMGIDDSSDAFVINTDDAFDATLANNSFSIDANHNVIIAGDVSVGDDLFLTSSGSIINWNSGDVTLTHASGKLTFGGDGTVELDFNNHAISNDADLTIDGAADIILSADGDQIKMDDGSTTRFVFNVDSSPEIDVTGEFTIDGSSHITIDAAGNFTAKANAREVIKAKTDSTIYFHAYAQTLFDDYYININASNRLLTIGTADFQQNYSLLAKHSVSAGGTFNADFGT
jgi:hypothetical protein